MQHKLETVLLIWPKYSTETLQIAGSTPAPASRVACQWVLRAQTRVSSARVALTQNKEDERHSCRCILRAARRAAKMLRYLLPSWRGCPRIRQWRRKHCKLRVLEHLSFLLGVLHMPTQSPGAPALKTPHHDRTNDELLADADADTRAKKLIKGRSDCSTRISSIGSDRRCQTLKKPRASRPIHRHPTKLTSTRRPTLPIRYSGRNGRRLQRCST